MLNLYLSAVRIFEGKARQKQESCNMLDAGFEPATHSSRARMQSYISTFEDRLDFPQAWVRYHDKC
jgi:hypothetical protein